MGNTADTLDLHGLTTEEAIERFVQMYNERVKKSQGGAWTIVHGSGSSGQGGAVLLSTTTNLTVKSTAIISNPQKTTIG